MAGSVLTLHQRRTGLIGHLRHPVVHFRHAGVREGPAEQPAPERLRSVDVLGWELNVHYFTGHRLLLSGAVDEANLTDRQRRYALASLTAGEGSASTVQLSGRVPDRPRPFTSPQSRTAASVTEMCNSPENSPVVEARGCRAAPIGRPTKGAAMFGRMATYSFTGDAHDLARRAEQGILPIFQAQPGFQAYSVAAGDGQVLSLSVWDTRSDAEAGSEAAAAWVADNMAGELELITVRYAEVLFSTSLGVSTKAGATA
jgi:hypothetical protein